MRRSGRREAGQGQSRRKHMLAETGVGVFGIERIDQQDRAGFDWNCGRARVEDGGIQHLCRDPALSERPPK